MPAGEEKEVDFKEISEQEALSILKVLKGQGVAPALPPPAGGGTGGRPWA